MGKLKFFKAGYANFEASIFGTTNYQWNSSSQVSSPDYTMTYGNEQNNLLGYLYDNKTLTTPKSSYKYIVLGSGTGLSVPRWSSPFTFNSYIYQSYKIIKCTTNTEHNFNQNNFTNVIENSDISFISAISTNGLVSVTFNIINNGDTDIVVNSIEQSGSSYSSASFSGYGAQSYFLDWAYYFEDDAVSIPAHDSKVVTIQIKLGNLID